ncbi:hypothetical protein SAMN06295885_3518 [Rathayibacter oskolensis]|uniref:Sortase n=1 Tax=Rathayibacter oskolensis TaxID=1891671 RepID=A0A1X7PG01_9MICO|nr:sortase [Rathayibacter oskolensis]SMH50392.1 hypothetical protein SAMN06295885_3518 [Rathayibacter oskolensis]
MPHARAIGAVLAALLLAPSASADDLLEVRELSSPATLRDLAPGDTAEWAVEVTGASAGDLSVGFAVDGGDALATDPQNGLQLVVDLCSTSFSVVERRAGGRTISRYLCPGDEVRLGAGPAAELGSLDGVRAVEGGETTGVRVRVAFPSAAGNELEGTRAALRVVVTRADGSPEPVAPGSVPGAAGPDGLAVTGRDLGAALLGGLLALGGGALLAALARRRQEQS